MLDEILGNAAEVPITEHATDTHGVTLVNFGLVVASLRRSGRRIDDQVLAHVSPAHSENVNFFGAIEVDIGGELAQLGPTGYRPLRAPDTLF